MTRYIALLRGINISGKNKISMSELKRSFAGLNFAEVATYLNSGNVLFSCATGEKHVLANKITCMIKEEFGLEIPVLIILQDELKDVLTQAPDWWGDANKEIYDNLIFMIPPLTYEAFYEEMGNPKAEYEKTHHCQNVIFWSFSRKDYQKTNWWSKTASATVSGKITIRAASTVRKIVDM